MQEKCEYTQYHLAVCLKMIITINVMPVYSPIQNDSKMENEFGVLTKYACVPIIPALEKQRQEDFHKF